MEKKVFVDIKDLEERSSRITQVGHKSNDRTSFRRERQREIKHMEERASKHQGREWNYRVSSQGTPVANRAGRGKDWFSL